MTIEKNVCRVCDRLHATRGRRKNMTCLDCHGELEWAAYNRYRCAKENCRLLHASGLRFLIRSADRARARAHWAG